MNVLKKLPKKQIDLGLFDKQKSSVLDSSDLSRKGNVDEPIRVFLGKLNSEEDFFSLSSCSGRIIILRQQVQSKGDVDVNKKKGCDWILVSHETVDPEEAWTKLRNSIEDCIKDPIRDLTKDLANNFDIEESAGTLTCDVLSEDSSKSDVSEGDTKSILEKDSNSENIGIVVLKFEPFILHVQCRDVDSAKKLHTQSIESGFRNSGLTLGKSGKIVLAVRSTHGLEVPLTDPQTGQLLVDEKYVRTIVKLANEKLVENFKRIVLFEEKCSKHVFNLVN